MRKLLTFLLIIMAFLLIAAEIVITDISPIIPEYSAVKFLVENQIMELDVNGNFKPSLLVTRLDIAKLLYTLIQKYNLSKLSEIENNLKNINDELNISKGLITGIDKRVENLENEKALLTKTIDEIQNFISNASNTLLIARKVDDIYIRINNIENSYVKKEDLAALSEQISTISQIYNSNMMKFEEKINSIEKIDEVEKKVNIINNKVDELRTSFLEEQARNKAKFSEIDEKISNIPTNVANLNVMLSQLSDRLSTIEGLYTELRNLTPSDLQKVSKIDDIESRVNEIYATISELKGFSGSLDDFRKRLEGVDVLTVRNVVNKFAVLENNYQQIDARMQNVENYIEKVELLDRKIQELELKMNEFEKKEMALNNIETVSNDLEMLKNYKKDSEEVLNVMSDKIIELDNNIRTIMIISMVSVTISIIGFIAAIIQ